MAKIYKNFEDLVEQNKGLFQVILKTGNKNTLEAIWNARQTEIDFLVSDNLNLKRKNEELNNTLDLKLSEAQSLVAQRDNLHKEVQVMGSMIDSARKVQEELKLQVRNFKERYELTANEAKKRSLEQEATLRERDFVVARFKKLDSDYNLLSFEFEEFKKNCDKEMQENITIFENVMIERDNFKQETLKLASELKNLKMAFSNIQINYEKSRELLEASKESIIELEGNYEKACELLESRQKNITDKDSEIKKLTSLIERKNGELDHFINCFSDLQKNLAGSRVRKHTPGINQ